MHYLISLLLLAGCGSALQGAAGRLVPLRRNAYAVYADSSGEEYEPYAVLPLHSPLPFLQLLSPAPSPAPAPASTPRRRRPAKRRPAPESAELYAVDASHVEQSYEPGYSSELYSAELEPQPAKYSKNRDQYDDDVVVYARPNRHGGYSYRRPAQHAAPAPQAASATSAYYAAPTTSAHYAAPATPAHYAAPATPAHYTAHAPRPREPQKPVIIRIHKYRVIH